MYINFNYSCLSDIFSWSPQYYSPHAPFVNEIYVERERETKLDQRITYITW